MGVAMPDQVVQSWPILVLAAAVVFVGVALLLLLKRKPAAAAATSEGENGTRSRLAWAIVICSVIGVVLLGTVVIIFADRTKRYEAAQLVLTALLPLMGTWVGTVLAFYFAKENLQAATESTLKLRAPMDGDVPVKDVMIRADSIDHERLAAGTDLAALPLSQVHTKMKTTNRDRIPVLDASGAVLIVIHASTLSQYAGKINEKIDALTKKAKDLADDAEYGPLVKAIAFVAADAKLDAARRAMRNTPKCNDVFVTEGGQGREPIVGWLTNTELAKRE